MKFESSFTTEKMKEEVVELTTAYFIAQGFKLSSSQADTLVFTRGSQLSNFYTFNPLNIQSKTRIQLLNTGTSTSVNALFALDTVGQAITLQDEAIWQGFVENYQRSILTGQDLSAETQQLLQEGKKANLKYVGWALLAGIPAGFIAHWTEVDSIASTGAVAGAIGLTYYKINQDKEREKNGL
jgi:hypothetical protein